MEVVVVGGIVVRAERRREEIAAPVAHLVQEAAFHGILVEVALDHHGRAIRKREAGYVDGIAGCVLAPAPGLLVVDTPA
jgi:hypothetical protein